MDKSIVVITGSWGAKKKFNKIARKSCFVRNENLGKRARNNDSDSEELLINEKIENFLQDDSEVKKISIGKRVKTFSSALLVLHYISRELTEKLKESNGIIQIHVANKNDLFVKIEDHDVVLYADDQNFKMEVERVINILNPKTKQNNQIEEEKTIEQTTNQIIK